jgi:hypothetical protein
MEVRMSWRNISPTVMLSVLLALPGCSIAMALHGNPAPNFDIIKFGATQEEVEFELNSSGTTNELGDGKKAVTYKYEVGNSPNPGRAMVNGYVDLYTIGLAEPILTIIELIQGDDVETEIVYGPDQRVLEIHGYTPPLPSAELKAAQEEQEKYMRKRPASRTDQPSSASATPSPQETNTPCVAC